MKVMLRKSREGQLEAYIPKRDLESPVVAQEKESLWGGWVQLANGLKIQLPAKDGPVLLPITVEAKVEGD